MLPRQGCRLHVDCPALRHSGGGRGGAVPAVGADAVQDDRVALEMNLLTLVTSAMALRRVAVGSALTVPHRVQATCWCGVRTMP